MNASNRAEGGTSAFSWVADSSSRLVVTATTSRYFFRHPVVTPFCEGVMRRTGSGWDRSFFWQFVNGTHDTTDCLKRVVPLVTPSVFDAFVPLFLAALPAAFFIACGRPNQERSSPPLLTVLPLLTGENQGHSEEVTGKRHLTSGS